MNTITTGYTENRTVPFLNRAPRGQSGWYRNSPYDCVAVVPENCDEWPWAASEQGGEPGPGGLQPHLQIISGGHNRFSGRDYQKFLDGCGVPQGGTFLVTPIPNVLLGTHWDNNQASPPIPSLHIKPGGTCL